MYAVIETGGKQYRVELGSELAIERLDAAPGETIRFERVLLVADGDAAQIGTPIVADALVTGEVLRQDRGEKIIVFKYRPKARHRSKKGHRQEQTVIRVADIRFNGRSAADESSEQEKATAKTRKAAAAEAEKKAAADQELAAKLAKDEAAREEKSKPAAAKTAAKAACQGCRRDEASGEEVNRKAKDDRRSRQACRGEVDDYGKGRCQACRDQGRQGRAKGEASGNEALYPQDHHEEGRVSPMAHKKAGSSSKNGRDSVGQRLGVKAGDGQLVSAGSIIVRQRGMTFLAGEGTDLGKDYTLFATVDGRVRFEHERRDKKRVRVEAETAPAQSAGGNA